MWPPLSRFSCSCLRVYSQRQPCYRLFSEVSEVSKSESAAMASGVLILLLFTLNIFHVTALFGNCEGYTSSYGFYKPSVSCRLYQFCCGTCENRYCCSDPTKHLSEDEQDACLIHVINQSISNGVIVLISLGILSVFVVIISCCCCPCCCLYNMCRKPETPVIGTSTTTVVNTQCIVPQPVVQGGQHPAYQPVPTQTAYGVQPMPAGPYQTQPYAPGPPPSYHTVAGLGYHSSGYPPAQEGFAHVPPQTDALKQPAYNPAYMQSPNTAY